MLITVLPLDDYELSFKINETLNSKATETNISILFSKTSNLIQKVVDRRNKKKNSSVNTGASSLSIRTDARAANEVPFASAIQTATALRICQLFILNINKAYLPYKANMVLTSSGSEEPPIESLVDLTLELVSDDNVTSTYYEVLKMCLLCMHIAMSLSNLFHLQ